MSPRLIYPVEKYTPRTWRFIVLGAVAYIAMVIITWQVHTGWSIFFGIAGFHAFITCFLTDKPRMWFLRWSGIVLGVGFVLACIIFLPCPNRSSNIRMGTSLKIQSSGIEQSLEEYAAGNADHYPLSTTQLDRSVYTLIDSRNPYAWCHTTFHRWLGHSNRTPDEPVDAIAQHSYTGEYLTEADLKTRQVMHHVEITDPEHVGNFTYVPRLERDETGEIICTGYTFVLYGLSMYNSNKYLNHLYGDDAWEHVTMVVDSEGKRIEYH